MIKADERASAMASSAHGGNMHADDTVHSPTDALPKCCCTWKNCRAYQKAWREAKHSWMDGVIKIKLVRDHPESMALKACIDRTLTVPETKSSDWKAAKKAGSPEHVKYIVARHHFTEKHVQKYLQSPKSFSFLKPFSIHGANKYLYSVNRNETLATAGGGEQGNVDDSDLLYLQCPSVPKDIVKEEFYRVMEKVKASKKKQSNNIVAAASTNPKKTAEPDVAVSLHHKEVENRILKDQLDAMKSQLTFLHDMVQKLQEQHFTDHQSVHTGRSSKHASRVRRGSAYSKPRSTSGVPHEIELGDEGEDETYWNEPTDGDWTDNYNSESNRDEDDEDDDEQTTNTFQVTYRASRQGSGGSVASKAASTIVSASKSVKTLPREIELDEDEDDSESHESLEEEAFDNRSFASSARSRNTGNDTVSLRSSRRGSFAGSTAARSFVSDNNNSSNGNNNRSSKGPSAMNASTRKSIGPNSKMPSRRVSNGEAGSVQSRKLSTGTNESDASLETGTYEVTAMVVTDPYGEKGSYTGSISSSTGMPNGYGRLEYDKAGRWYEGDWKHGRWTGIGRLSNGDGDFYEGGLKNDHKHGIGKMKFADGRTFEGEYINGQMVEGKMTYQDGSTYHGSWVDGMRHGRGRCVFTDVSIYEGEFKEGEFFGHGKMSWNDGGWYEGEWLNGDMHGRGREVRADGSLRHDGEWLKGQPIRNKK